MLLALFRVIVPILLPIKEHHKSPIFNCFCHLPSNPTAASSDPFADC
jgi:hypothetical protein